MFADSYRVELSIQLLAPMSKIQEPDGCTEIAILIY
jgi:hypothetical protein